MKRRCLWRDCAESQQEEHAHLDHCWNCAPFWRWIPECPSHSLKLSQKGWCRECQKYYNITHRPLSLRAGLYHPKIMVAP
jgi:hypothetical protein